MYWKPKKAHHEKVTTPRPGKISMAPLKYTNHLPSPSLVASQIRNHPSDEMLMRGCEDARMQVCKCAWGY
jgi:hypothetical protein